MSPIGYHLKISAPIKGESYLRIILHDVPSNRFFGAIEVPVAAIESPSPRGRTHRPPRPNHPGNTARHVPALNWCLGAWHLQPALSTMVPGQHLSSSGSLAFSASLSVHPPHLRPTLWLLLPACGAIAGTADTARCMQRRWSFYHGGVLLCLYMDLLVLPWFSSSSSSLTSSENKE